MIVPGTYSAGETTELCVDVPNRTSLTGKTLLLHVLKNGSTVYANHFLFLFLFATGAFAKWSLSASVPWVSVF